MRQHLKLACVMLALVACPAVAHAQQDQQPQQPLMSQSATEAFDTIHLKNGGLYRGRVTEIVPDDHVMMILESGEKKRLTWSEIARIVTSTSTAPTTPPTPPTPPTTTTPTTPPVAGATPPTLDVPITPLPPPLVWRPNGPLLVTGTIMFATGYVPNAFAALPSTIGLAGRVILLVLTIGLPCIFNNSDDYLCNGSHGAMELLLPFGGPFWFVNDHPHDSVINKDGGQVSDTAKALLYTSAGLQIAGVTSILGSLVFGGYEAAKPKKSSFLQLDMPFTRGGDKDASDHPLFFVAPMNAPSGTVGVSIGISRW